MASTPLEKTAPWPLPAEYASGPAPQPSASSEVAWQQSQPRALQMPSRAFTTGGEVSDLGDSSRSNKLSLAIASKPAPAAGDPAARPEVSAGEGLQRGRSVRFEGPGPEEEEDDDALNTTRPDLALDLGFGHLVDPHSEPNTATAPARSRSRKMLDAVKNLFGSLATNMTRSRISTGPVSFRFFLIRRSSKVVALLSVPVASIMCCSVAIVWVT